MLLCDLASGEKCIHPKSSGGQRGARRQFSCPAALRGLIRPCLDVSLGNDLMVILRILSVVDDKFIIFISSHEPFVKNVFLPSHICNTSNHANKVHVFNLEGRGETFCRLNSDADLHIGAAGGRFKKAAPQCGWRRHQRSRH